jgi:hypothetical protein
MLKSYFPWLLAPACRRNPAACDLARLLQLDDAIGHFGFMWRQFVVLSARPAGDLHKSPGWASRIIGISRFYEMQSAAREEEAVVSKRFF